MKKSPYFLIKVAFVIIMFLILSGTYFFKHLEGWSWVDAFYFTVMTVTTVGYGDLVPSHDIAKIVTAIFGMISIPLFVFAFSGIVESYMDTRMNRLEGKMRKLLKIEEEIDEAIEEERAIVKPSLLRRIMGIK